MKFSKKLIISAGVVLLCLILIAFDFISGFAALTFLVASVFLIIEIVKMANANEKGKLKKFGIGVVSSLGMTFLLFTALFIAIPISDPPQPEIDTKTETVSKIESKIESKKETATNTITSLVESKVVVSSKVESKVVSSKAVSSKEESKIESKNENKVESKTVSKTESKAESKVGSQVESKAESKVESVYIERPPQAKTFCFIVNTNTNKFHLPDCHDVEKIAPENYSECLITDEKLSDAIQRMIDNGYSPCGHCIR